MLKKPNKGCPAMWTAPDVFVQNTPVIAGALYRPEFMTEECEALCTGECPVDADEPDTTCLCVQIAQELKAGRIPDMYTDEPIEILHDSDRGLAVFESGARLACVYHHVAAECPDLCIPTAVRLCRFYSEPKPVNIIVFTGGEWVENYGTPSAVIKRLQTDRKLERNSLRSRFTFPEHLATKEIVFSHGHYAVQFDTSWSLLNPKDAYDAEYAYYADLRHADPGCYEYVIRPVIYFTGTASLDRAYDELAAMDPYWMPCDVSPVRSGDYEGAPILIAREEMK